MPTLLSARAVGAHLLMLLALAGAIALGLWQFHVWGGDRAAAQVNLTHAKAVPLGSVIGPDSAFPGDSLGRPVTFTGTWVTSGTMYVSHRPRHGVRGYWTVTPVLVGKSAIPVVRGWSPSPSAPAATGSVRVTGWLEPSDGTGEADTNPNDDIITSMRIASMTQHVNADLYSAYVVAQQASNATTGLSPVGPVSQPNVSGFTGLRNLLYAFQWWIFGGLAIYVWVRWCLDEIEKERNPGGDPDVVSDTPAGGAGLEPAGPEVPSSP